MNSWPMFTYPKTILSISRAMFITSYDEAGHLTDDDHTPAG
ncbi:hypothetical protein [Oceanobacillus picturae]|nr:hypothetical protein [Oceanobacillus picturae]